MAGSHKGATDLNSCIVSAFKMKRLGFLLILTFYIQRRICRDEDKIMKACYWPNEIYEPCFGGCAEVSCDNPRTHLRPCYPYCEPGCVCEEPYVRDDRTHQCVLPQDCSPTQMGIPVPAIKRQEMKSPLPSPMPKYSSRAARVYNKRDDFPMDFTERDAEVPNNNINNPNQKDDFKRGAEVSRMGNYFNIVIAPPPIKALQPRKIIQSDAYRAAAKRVN